MEDSTKKVISKGNALTEHPFLSLLFIFIGMCVITSVLMNSLTAGTPVSHEVRMVREYGVSVLACAKDEVRAMLKSPSTADFPMVSSNDVVQFVESQNNTLQFSVTSYVDAQNSFGAEIRSGYDCNILISPDKTRCAAECVVN